MVCKVVLLCCAFLLLVQTEAFVRRDVSDKPSAPNVLEAFQKNMEQFRKCLDQSLASAVDDINENKLKPVLTQVSDSLNRVSKAFEDLTAPAPPKDT
ncbi:hypothetical protein NE865_10939 [Phthorimaea operculella]|nr:hypothetical protein NE865_10939 [Phthorimaea operculella]